ncbi:protein of unknown function [Hyphomicrobium sp. 1Nfss2.1]
MRQRHKQHRQPVKDCDEKPLIQPALKNSHVHMLASRIFNGQLAQPINATKSRLK